MSADPFLVRFAREYGWRAYAIPVLAVVTLWVLVDMLIAPDQPLNKDTNAVSVEDAINNTAAKDPKNLGGGPNPAYDSNNVSLPLGELPQGGAFTETGSGTFHSVPGTSPKVGVGKEKVVTYVVEVEDGVDTSAYGGDDTFARMIDATLADPRSWIHDEKFAFERVDPAVVSEPSLHIQLTSPSTTHNMCGQDIRLETSCFTTEGNRVLLNESRWVRGAITFHGDMGSYRQYAINHEVGHGIGYASHEPCGGNGKLAPVMMQQTLSLNNSELFKLAPTEVYPDNNATCLMNPWPYPPI